MKKSKILVYLGTKCTSDRTQTMNSSLSIRWRYKLTFCFTRLSFIRYFLLYCNLSSFNSSYLARTLSVLCCSWWRHRRNFHIGGLACFIFWRNLWCHPSIKLLVRGIFVFTRSWTLQKSLLNNAGVVAVPMYVRSKYLITLDSSGGSSVISCANLFETSFDGTNAIAAAAAEFWFLHFDFYILHFDFNVLQFEKPVLQNVGKTFSKMKFFNVSAHRVVG